MVSTLIVYASSPARYAFTLPCDFTILIDTMALLYPEFRGCSTELRTACYSIPQGRQELEALPVIQSYRKPLQCCIPTLTALAFNGQSSYR